MIDKLNATFKRMLTDGAKDGIAPTVVPRVIAFAANIIHETDVGPRHF